MVQWCAPCSSHTLQSLHHTPPTIHYTHRVDRWGNPKIHSDSDCSVDPSPLNDKHTDLWPDHTAPTTNLEGHTHRLQIRWKFSLICPKTYSSFRKIFFCRIIRSVYRFLMWVTFAAVRSKAKCQGCTGITAAADHIEFTLTEPSQFTAGLTERADDITPATWQQAKHKNNHQRIKNSKTMKLTQKTSKELLTKGSVVDPCRHALDESFTDFWLWLLWVELRSQSHAVKTVERVKVTLGAEILD